MTVIRKNITVWQSRNCARSQASMEALNKEVATFTAYLEKLYAENWKYNLVSLYFPVKFTAAAVMESNKISQKYRLAILDVTAEIQEASREQQESLYQKYALLIFDMCGHYEAVYSKMEQDRIIVKDELLRDFSIA